MNVKEARDVLTHAQQRKDARQSVGVSQLLDAMHVMSRALNSTKLSKPKRFVVKVSYDECPLNSLSLGAYFELDDDIQQVITKSDKDSVPIWAVRLRDRIDSPHNRNLAVRVLKLVSGVFE